MGFHRFTYDVWGATVHRASRLESHAGNNAVSVDERCASVLGKSRIKRLFTVHPPVPLNMGGVQMVNTFRVERSGEIELVAKAPSHELRFWKEHELEARPRPDQTKLHLALPLRGASALNAIGECLPQWLRRGA